ncbi:hypothetical protein K1T71_000103 [Dendrolimus kikuchii]|uniref:Uncharacterized protein n=1 Tax=Dendrolimus kikuchii TaxID=765133 RepID=A0ACC1DIJ8_9NEOP|nr:hypothetical protein K1T71_000103 [Dendrolimus kikuchii]
MFEKESKITSGDLTIISDQENEPKVITQEESSSNNNHKIKEVVVAYLQTQKGGTTIPKIIQHLRGSFVTDESKLYRIVENFLESGLTLGFLERRKSKFSEFSPVESCGKRRSCCRRKRRRRSCCRRKRRRRSCCRRRRQRKIRRRRKCRRRRGRRC